MGKISSDRRKNCTVMRGEEIFQVEKFFHLEDFPYKDIFQGGEFVWEAIPKIAEFTGGKVLYGKNCRIAKSALLREGVILGDNVVIGHCVELKNSLVMSNSAVAHLNYVGDSIIGNNVNVAAGVVLANFRLDGKEIMVKTNKDYKSHKIYKTGLVKFGAVVGDGSKIGVNSVLNPGTILGKNCWIYPLVSVSGYYKNSSLIKK